MVYLINLGNRILSEGLSRIVRESDSEVTILNCHASSLINDPDLVIFDSFREVCALKEKYPDAKALFIDSGLPDKEIACLLLCHQVSGIIAPNTDLLNFKKALKVILKGEVWIDQANLRAMQKSGLSLLKGPGELKGLSDQDMKIVALVTKGQRNKDIATCMCISESTVKSHISRIYKKLNVKNRAQLITLSSDNMRFIPQVPPS